MAVSVPVTWRGDWSDVAYYVLGDVVSYTGVLWVCEAGVNVQLLDVEPGDDDRWVQFSGEGGTAITGDGSITTVVKVTQAEYDGLTPDDHTFYVIVG